MKATFILLFIFLAAGCSNRAVYENLQINKRTECSKLPLSEYDQCIAGIDKSYDEYERERQEVIGD